MIVDANILLYSVNESSPFHERARAWLDGELRGRTRVGIPWQSLTAFLRIATHPSASAHPLEPDAAWRFALDWLAFDTAWTPTVTRRHADVLGGLITRYQLRGNHVQDAHLAALAIEHGLAVASADSDFARFTEVRWINPLAGE